MPRSSRWLTELEPGRVLAGRYRLGALLGQGAFGVVFRATQIDLGREVALKLLHADALASPSAVARFHREAELAKTLEHPNTVRLYDFGQTAEGVPYIAWQLLRGRALEKALSAEGPFSIERTARVTSQVLRSLIEAHERGIVHRDIKPANIFLAEFQGTAEFVKVLDFGVAKAVLPDAGTYAALTLEGQIVGTPYYMAPEQFLAEEVVPATDLYALGLVMAELLTLRCAHDGLGAAELIEAHRSGEPTPIPEEALATQLGPVIARATAKPLSTRFASARAMLHALEAALQAGGRTLGPLYGEEEPSTTGRTEQLAAPTPLPRPASSPWASGPVADAALASTEKGVLPQELPTSARPSAASAATMPAPEGTASTEQDALQVGAAGPMGLTAARAAVAASPPAPRRKRSTVTVVLVALLAVAALALAGVVGALVVVSRASSRPEPEAAVAPPPAAEPTPAAPAPQPAAPLPPPAKVASASPTPPAPVEPPGWLASATQEQVRTRLEALSWQVLAVTALPATQHSVGGYYISMSKTGSTGVVMVFDCETRDKALLAEATSRGGYGAVGRDGNRVLAVSVMLGSEPTPDPMRSSQLKGQLMSP